MFTLQSKNTNEITIGYLLVIYQKSCKNSYRQLFKYKVVYHLTYSY